MFDARRVATLYARRRRLTLGLADFERRAEVYRKALAEVEAELRTRVLFVPPLILRRSPAVGSRHILDFLLESGTPRTTAEIALWIMTQKGHQTTDPQAVRAIRKRVLVSLTRLAKRGVVRVEAESRRVVRWELIG